MLTHLYSPLPHRISTKRCNQLNQQTLISLNMDLSINLGNYITSKSSKNEILANKIKLWKLSMRSWMQKKGFGLLKRAPIDQQLLL